MAEKDLAALQAGDRHYKAFVGPPLKYDLLGALQFNLLTAAGLRDHHRLLDIGCGSLRAGKLFIPYLRPAHYCGLEPEQWLVQEGIERELGTALLDLKKPQFSYRSDFSLADFEGPFDFVLAQSIFSHASAAQIQKCISEVAAKLAPQGLFCFTFLPGAQDYQGEAWVYPGCVYYRPASFRAWAGAQNLELQATNWPHPNGQAWWIMHRPEARARARALAQYSLAAYRADGPDAPHFWARLWRRFNR